MPTAIDTAKVVDFLGAPSGTTDAEWVAKARQESSHNPVASNSGHIGLWQIGLEHKGIVGTTAFMTKAKFEEWLKNPFNNFRAAKALYGAGKWKPWDASGGKPTPTDADKQAVKDAKDQAGGVDEIIDKAGDIAGDLVPDPLKNITDLALNGYKWITDRRNIGRIVMGLVGTTVLVGSLVVLAKPVVTSVEKGVVPV